MVFTTNGFSLPRGHFAYVGMISLDRKVESEMRPNIEAVASVLSCR
jgi:hypothetical protein